MNLRVLEKLSIFKLIYKNPLLGTKMPPKRPKIYKYTPGNLIDAVAAVRSKVMTYKEASERFEVPITTIHERNAALLRSNQVKIFVNWISKK